MNYRHIYHAGNAGDVLKHILLIHLMKFMQQKDAPCTYMDTHAGLGSYDLTHTNAQKNKEYLNGVGKLLHAEDAPENIADYLELIKANNKEKALQFYPGSPYILKQFARPKDPIILCEKHPETYQNLKKNIRGKTIAIHHRDGYQALEALLPFKTKRGLILIDPAYEENDEYKVLVTYLRIALERFHQGVYAIWYPIKALATKNHFLKTIKNAVKQPTLITEIMTHETLSPQLLNGCGMIVINPPWQLTDTLQSLIPWVSRQLSEDGKERYHIDLLV